MKLNIFKGHVYQLNEHESFHFDNEYDIPYEL